MSGESRSIDHLVRMANDIGHFFASEPKRADAIAGIANHLQRAWASRMLQQIIAYAKGGGAGLDELPREAIALLKVPEPPPPVGAGGGASGTGNAGSAAAVAGTATRAGAAQRSKPV